MTKISDLNAEALAEGAKAASEGRDDNPYSTSGSDLLATFATVGLLGPLVLSGKDEEKATAWRVGHALGEKKK